MGSRPRQRAEIALPMVCPTLSWLNTVCTETDALRPAQGERVNASVK